MYDLLNFYLYSIFFISTSLSWFLFFTGATTTLSFINFESDNTNTVNLPMLNDGFSEAINIPVGFAFGNTSQANVYVRLWNYCLKLHKFNGYKIENLIYFLQLIMYYQIQHNMKTKKVY